MRTCLWVLATPMRMQVSHCHRVPARYNNSEKPPFNSSTAEHVQPSGCWIQVCEKSSGHSFGSEDETSNIIYGKNKRKIWCRGIAQHVLLPGRSPSIIREKYKHVSCPTREASLHFKLWHAREDHHAGHHCILSALHAANRHQDTIDTCSYDIIWHDPIVIQEVFAEMVQDVDITSDEGGKAFKFRKTSPKSPSGPVSDWPLAKAIAVANARANFIGDILLNSRFEMTRSWVSEWAGLVATETAHAF